MILIIFIIFLLLYVALKVIDAFVFPIKYCLNGDRDVDGVSFISHIPFQKG